MRRRERSALSEIELSPDYVIVKPPPGAVVLPVLKLHGSINWRLCKSTTCGQVVLDDTEKQTRQCPVLSHHEMGPFIVLPTWDKGSGNEAIAKVWAAAHKQLVQGHRWIIIWYSAPPSDRFFQYLLGSALAEDKHLELVAVFNCAQDDAEQSSIRERYKRLFTRSFADRRLEFFLGEKFPSEAAGPLAELVR